MGLSLKIRAAKRLYQNRDALRTFLRFCDDPNFAFSGSVQPNELAFLAELVTKANVIPGPIIEIGTLFGFTTQKIAQSKAPEKPLITVDNYCWNPFGMSPDAHREFTRRSLSYITNLASTQLYEGDNREFYRTYSGPRPAMIFIDAGHTYEEVLVDIRWAVEQKIPIISGHDYGASDAGGGRELWPGIRKAVDETFGSKIKVVGSVWAHVA